MLENFHWTDGPLRFGPWALGVESAELTDPEGKGALGVGFFVDRAPVLGSSWSLGKAGCPLRVVEVTGPAG